MITSKDNSAVKALKKLLVQPRRSDARMVIEGIHACQMYLAQGKYPLLVWVGDSAQKQNEIAALLVQLTAAKVTVHVLSDALFRELSTLEQGVSLLFEVERPMLQAHFSRANAVMLDGVQDPGNVGSILRSAAAAGVTNVFLNATCANPFSPKVLRAAVGAHFSLIIYENVQFEQAFTALREQGVRIVATSSYAASDVYEVDLTGAVAWVFGNEGAGVSEHLLMQADARAIIPMVAGESLNVAAAAAICLFEMQRQQRSIT